MTVHASTVVDLNIGIALSNHRKIASGCRNGLRTRHAAR
jgi:hypothetical protein